ncbi:hypothetical protein BP6252_07054 [Coleophoma cylindrospora]|uniref:Uncharacterized protein n=1 Tax=Coleophoma cylindrospora TaxID=1849047 RepID=A0A3D8RGI5_9HELO|nr:hypothetical protein BP6252_07054 [Coleophoma cylindrospora]
MTSIDSNSGSAPSKRSSFRRMLDLERKSKLDRMRASASFAVQSPSSTAPPIPTRLSYAPSSSQPQMRQTTRRTKTAPPTAPPPPIPIPPINPRLEQHMSVQLPDASPWEESAICASPEALTIEIPSRELDEDSDRSSICQSPGWGDAKERKRKHEAKEKRKKEKEKAEKERLKVEKERAKTEKEKVKSDKDAREAKKLKKRLNNGPPTNKIFNRMAIPMERSVSAPVVVALSEEKASQGGSSKPSSSSSRRSSLEVGLKSLRSLTGSWKQNETPGSPQELPADAEGFVGGLKLQNERDLALQNQIRKLTLDEPSAVLTGRAKKPVQTRSMSAEAVSVGAGSKFRYLEFHPTMPPELSESEAETDSFHNPASYAARASKQPTFNSQESSTSIMERKIRRPRKNRGSDKHEPMSNQNDNRHSLEERTGSRDGDTSQFSFDTQSARRLSPTYNPDSETLASHEDLDGSRGRKGSDTTNDARQVRRGRPVTAYHTERRASHATFHQTSQSASRSHQRCLSVQPDVANEWDGQQGNEETTMKFGGELEERSARSRDSYHSFVAQSQILPPHQQQANLQGEDKPSKVYPNSPSFKTFRSAARAAFSRNSQVPPLPVTGLTGSIPGHHSRSSTTQSFADSQRALSKAERILGETDLPAPRSMQKSSATKSQSSSLLSSSDGSILDEDSNITTPSASRPQSHKGEFSPSREPGHHASTAVDFMPPPIAAASSSNHGEEMLGTSPITKDDTDWQMPALNAHKKKSSLNNISRRPSLPRSLSTPELQQDLSFLPPLKHQSLERSSKGKEKEVTRQQPSKAADEELGGTSLAHSASTTVQGQRPTLTKEDGGQYLQNARLNVLRTSPKSKSGSFGSTVGPKPGMDSIAKMFVVCCSCLYFHDLPSKVYECMTRPDNIVEDKDLGLTGQMTTMVRCPWCEHGMSTSCCSGILTTLQVVQKLH